MDTDDHIYPAARADEDDSEPGIKSLLDSSMDSHLRQGLAGRQRASAAGSSKSGTGGSADWTAAARPPVLARRAQLRRRREESVEVGGYFICNGLERIIRLLVQQRRHYVMGLRRSAYHKRGPAFSDVATLLRCAWH